MFRWTMLNFGLVSSLKLSPENGWSWNTFFVPLGFRPYFHGRNVAVRFREGIPPFTNPTILTMENQPWMKIRISLLKKWWIFQLAIQCWGSSRSIVSGHNMRLDVDLFLGPQVLVATFLVRGTSGVSWNFRETSRNLAVASLFGPEKMLGMEDNFPSFIYIPAV